jgi:dihydrofolate reductase
MARIAVVNFMTLDGVVQSPLAPDEDTDGGFTGGGWVSEAMDGVVGRVMGDATVAAGGFLLGRRTYQNFAKLWSVADQREPAVAALNRLPKSRVTRSAS